MFKKKYLTILLFILFAMPVVADGDVNRILTIKPSQLYTSDDHMVHLSFQPEESYAQLHLLLLERDGTEKKDGIQAHWDLRDDGMWGDQQANDGRYERTISFKEKKVGQLHFVVTDAEDYHLYKQAALQVRGELQIIQRPSFLDLIELAWERIRKKIF